MRARLAVLVRSNAPYPPTRQVLGFARTILGFLQRNCTKENATYWLLRDAASDQVQLFDVTALMGKAPPGAAADPAAQRVQGSPDEAQGSVRAGGVRGSAAVARRRCARTLVRAPLCVRRLTPAPTLRSKPPQESLPAPGGEGGGAQPVSSSSMGLLCLRLAEKLQIGRAHV